MLSYINGINGDCALRGIRHRHRDTGYVVGKLVSELLFCWNIKEHSTVTTYCNITLITLSHSQYNTVFSLQSSVQSSEALSLLAYGKFRSFPSTVLWYRWYRQRLQAAISAIGLAVLSRSLLSLPSSGSV